MSAGMAMLDNYRKEIGENLAGSGQDLDTFISRAKTILRTTKAVSSIADTNPSSWLVSLFDCARRGHLPNTDSYYIYARGRELTGHESYRGIVQRLHRMGAVRNLLAYVVRERDSFEFNPGLHTQPLHRIDWTGDRGELVAVYAYAMLHTEQYSRVEVLTKAEVEKHKAQGGPHGPKSPWILWPEQCWLKTAVRRLEPALPTTGNPGMDPSETEPETPPAYHVPTQDAFPQSEESP